MDMALGVIANEAYQDCPRRCGPIPEARGAVYDCECLPQQARAA